jgi:hypothetical protein
MWQPENRMVAEPRPRRRRRYQSVARLSGFKPGPVVWCGFRAVRRDAAMTDHIWASSATAAKKGRAWCSTSMACATIVRLLPIKRCQLSDESIEKRIFTNRHLRSRQLEYFIATFAENGST